MFVICIHSTHELQSFWSILFACGKFEQANDEAVVWEQRAHKPTHQSTWLDRQNWKIIPFIYDIIIQRVLRWKEHVLWPCTLNSHTHSRFIAQWSFRWRVWMPPVFSVSTWRMAAGDVPTTALHRNGDQFRGFEFNSPWITVYIKVYRFVLVEIGDFDVLLFRTHYIVHSVCLRCVMACVFMMGEWQWIGGFVFDCVYFYFIHRCQFVSHPKNGP